MKTYIDNTDTIYIDNMYIPKADDNRHYQQFLEELKKGEAELVPFIPPAPTWEQIRQQRDSLLKESDWVGLSDVEISNKQAWLDYRQALRDIPQTFSNPSEVVWPVKP
jgi:hypothetical protein